MDLVQVVGVNVVQFVYEILHLCIPIRSHELRVIKRIQPVLFVDTNFPLSPLVIFIAITFANYRESLARQVDGTFLAIPILLAIRLRDKLGQFVCMVLTIFSLIIRSNRDEGLPFAFVPVRVDEWGLPVREELIVDACILVRVVVIEHSVI